MRNSEYLLFIFAVFAFQALCEPIWVNKSFSLSPYLLKTTQITQKRPRVSFDLLNGPYTGLNLLAFGIKTEKVRTSELMLLNTTSLAIVRDFFDIGSLYSVSKVALVSTAQDIFYTVVKKDDQNINQIFGFRLDPVSYFPEEFQLTNSSERRKSFQVVKLISNSRNPVLVYMERSRNNLTLFAGVISLRRQTLRETIEIVSGDIKNVICDGDLSSTSIVCLYKLNQTVYRAHVPLKGRSNSPNIESAVTDDSKDMYVPQKVIGTKDYFFYFIANKRSDRTELLAHRLDIDSYWSVSLSKVALLKNFSSVDSRPLREVMAYGRGFAAFYRNFDNKGNQTWSYRIFDNDLKGNGTEVKFADILGKEPGFDVAKEYGSGAVNVMAYDFVSRNKSAVVNIYYGRLLNQSSIADS